jgi:hypothetical protein
VLAVTSEEVNAFTQHQAEPAAAAAGHAAFAIENARLYEAARGPRCTSANAWHANSMTPCHRCSRRRP